MESVRELRVLLDAKSPDEKKLKAVLEKIEKNQREMVKLRDKEFEAARDHLTVEQQARYLVFQREFMREMRGMISGARGQGRGMRGMGGAPLSGRPGGPMDDESYEDMPASPPRQQR
jgi:Spy/CpxP family protein refolding chaperone